jgi:tetratricopeptide (TPR) repeat protein
MALKSLINELHRRSIWQVIVGYLVFVWLLFETFEVLRVAVGLPDWVEPTAAVMLIVLFPALLATASVQRGAPARWPRITSDPPHPLHEPEPAGPAPSGSSKPAGPVAPAAPSGEPRGGGRRLTLPGLLTWRNTLFGGLGAFAVLALITAVYMVLRTSGIGPAGTLVAQGTLDERERLILADFESPEDLSDLAMTITEGMRVDLVQSPTVRLHSQRAVGAALTRMELEPDATLDMDLAREVALRESVRGVVGGALNRVGSSFVITAEVVDAADGSVLVSRRVTARDEDQLVHAVDELSKKLRERIGEPLASIGRADALERVTTGDLEALRKYSSAVRAIDMEGAADRGQALLEEAVALDPSFAMAWRKLGIALNNRGEERARIYEALSQAFEHRDRLTARERDLATAAYYSNATGDTRAAMAAYEALLEREPDDGTALNNLGVLHLNLRDEDEAIPLFETALQLDSTATIPFMNLIWAHGNRRDFARARAHVEAYPWLTHDPTAKEHAAQLWAARGEYEEATARLERLAADERGSPYWRTQTAVELAGIAAIEGRLEEAERRYRDAMGSNQERGLVGAALIDATRIARMELFVRDDAPSALTTLEFALRDHPLDDLEPLDRPYLELAEVYALAGRAGQARTLVERFEADVAPEIRSAEQRITLDRVLGAIALAYGDRDAALEATRRSDRGVCLLCALPQLARVFEAAGERDSAIATYERYVSRGYLFRARDTDPWHLGPIHERLGGLYAAKGEPAKAADHFARLIRLWDGADESLRRRVDEARRQAEALVPS